MFFNDARGQGFPPQLAARSAARFVVAVSARSSPGASFDALLFALASAKAQDSLLPCSNPRLYEACKIKQRLTALLYFTCSLGETAFELGWLMIGKILIINFSIFQFPHPLKDLG